MDCYRAVSSREGALPGLLDTATDPSVSGSLISDGADSEDNEADIPEIPDYSDSGDEDECFQARAGVDAIDLVRLANEMAQRPRVQQALQEELAASPGLRASFHEAADALTHSRGVRGQGLSRSLLLPTAPREELPRRRSLDLSDYVVPSDVELMGAQLDLEREVAGGRELQSSPEDELHKVLRQVGHGLRGAWRKARESFKSLAESIRPEQTDGEPPWRPVQQATGLRTEGVDANRIMLAAAVAAATGMLVHTIVTTHHRHDDR